MKFFLFVLSFTITVALFSSRHKQVNLRKLVTVNSPVGLPVESIIEPKVQEIQVQWTTVNPIRRTGIPGILGDICDHNKETFSYNNIAVKAHETLHGADSRLNYEHNRGYYCLNNKAAILKEPDNITLSQVARSVPNSLRGYNYSLYLAKQLRYWNDTPFYVLEETNAYIGGAEAAQEVSADFYSDVRFAMELHVYSLCAVMISNDKNSQTCAFLKYQTDRILKLRSQLPHPDEKLEKCMLTLSTSSDSQNLRSFCYQYFGESFCKDQFGF